MNESSTHTPKLISPSGTRRRPAVLPDWFFHDQYQNTRAGHSFCLLLSDSHGENFEDLLAAWYLRMKHSDKIRNGTRFMVRSTLTMLAEQLGSLGN